MDDNPYSAPQTAETPNTDGDSRRQLTRDVARELLWALLWLGLGLLPWLLMAAAGFDIG